MMFEEAMQISMLQHNIPVCDTLNTTFSGASTNHKLYKAIDVPDQNLHLTTAQAPKL